MSFLRRLRRFIRYHLRALGGRVRVVSVGLRGIDLGVQVARLGICLVRRPVRVEARLLGCILRFAQVRLRLVHPGLQLPDAFVLLIMGWLAFASREQQGEGKQHRARQVLTRSNAAKVDPHAMPPNSCAPPMGEERRAAPKAENAAPPQWLTLG